MGIGGSKQIGRGLGGTVGTVSDIQLPTGKGINWQGNKLAVWNIQLQLPTGIYTHWQWHSRINWLEIHGIVELSLYKKIIEPEGIQSSHNNLVGLKVRIKLSPFRNKKCINTIDLILTFEFHE